MSIFQKLTTKITSKEITPTKRELKDKAKKKFEEKKTHRPPCERMQPCDPTHGEHHYSEVYGNLRALPRTLNQKQNQPFICVIHIG